MRINSLILCTVNTFVKDVPVLNEAICHKDVWTCGARAPVLILGNRWRWVVSFTLWPLYTLAKSPWHPLDRRL